MQFATGFCSSDEVVRNALCLLRRVEEVWRVLKRRGFSEHAIDQAITAVYRAAMPYITGRKMCLIENRRAWVFRVAIRAACRAAVREVRCHQVEPAALPVLAATAPASEFRGMLFDLGEALGQLTAQQSQAVKLCILRGHSTREAARSMGISAGTLWGHLSAGKERLRAILADHEPQARTVESLNGRERA